MSRDSSGESLEAILASIRRSIAEQATNLLEEEVPLADDLPSADVLGDLDTPPVPRSLTRQRDAASESFQGSPSVLNGKAPVAPVAAIADPLPAPAPAIVLAPAVVPAAEAAAAPSPVAASEAPAGQGDPPWFLASAPGERAGAPSPAAWGGGVPAAQKSPGGSAASLAAERKPARAAEPEPSRMGVVRGPLPPFFGSSAEAMKVEIAPDLPVISSVIPPVVPGATSGAGAFPPVVSEPPLPPPPIGGVVGNGLEGPDGWPRATDGAVNGKASAIFRPASAEGRTADVEVSPQMQGLEGMVAELLRPMLRRWLDENMPRLVSAALKAEAEGMVRRDPGRDPKKP